MNWKQIVEGIHAGQLRIEYYFPSGTKVGRYRLVKLTVAGGYTDWRRVRVSPASIHRALRELYPATHGKSQAA